MYIRYQEVENLFKHQPTLEGILESLSVDMDVVRQRNSFGSNEEYIYNICIGNKSMDSMPPTGKISDLTGNVAANYMKIMRNDRKGVKNEVYNEALKIAVVLQKLDIAFRRLTLLQRRILTLFYWNDKTWAEIVDILKSENSFYEKRKIQDQRKIGIEKMVRILMITFETYDYVMGLIEKGI